MFYSLKNTLDQNAEIKIVSYQKKKNAEIKWGSCCYLPPLMSCYSLVDNLASSKWNKVLLSLTNFQYDGVFLEEKNKLA